jgi:SAM-dependent methyltransferase
MKQVLLLGCGTSRDRKIRLSSDEAADFSDCELTTIDMDPNCNPTKVHDISQGLPSDWGPEMFDEIHGYDSLEHWGVQGDWRGWLDEMGNYHDLLRPGGRFFCLVPTGEDRFADPGHTRFMSTNWFNVLCNDYYEERAAKGEHGGDYRWYWKKNFKRIVMQFVGDPAHHLVVVLEKDLVQIVVLEKA